MLMLSELLTSLQEPDRENQHVAAPTPPPLCSNYVRPDKGTAAPPSCLSACSGCYGTISVKRAGSARPVVGAGPEITASHKKNSPKNCWKTTLSTILFHLIKFIKKVESPCHLHFKCKAASIKGRNWLVRARGLVRTHWCSTRAAGSYVAKK